MIRNRWDKYEVAKLIEMYLCIQGISTERKKEKIAELSSLLRENAIKNGIEIKDTFRNFTGITMRLANIEYLFTEGKYGLSAYSKLDLEMYKLYTLELDKFELVLREADRKMVGEISSNTSQNDKFVDWVRKSYVDDADKILKNYRNTVNFMVEKHIIKNEKSIYVSVDYASFTIKTTIVNAEFKSVYKQNMRKIIRAMQIFILFLKTNKSSDYLDLKAMEQSDYKIKNDIIRHCDAGGIDEEFANWMISVNGMATNKCNSYRSAVNGVSDFAIKYNFTSKSFYEIFDSKEVKVIADRLFIDENFRIFNKNANNKFRVALTKYVEFLQNPKKASDVTRNMMQYERLDGFYVWMLNEKNMAETSCRSYKSAINGLSDYCNERNLLQGSLYELQDYTELQNIAEILLTDIEFLEFNESGHNRFRAAFVKYSEYINSTAQCLSRNHIENDVNLEMYKKLLTDKFPRGFKIGSAIEVNKLRRFYEDAFGEKIRVSDDEIQNRMRKVGILHIDRVYLPEMLVDEETRIKLISFIWDSFEDGKRIIYFEALFHTFSDELHGKLIYDAEMLKKYLLYINEYGWFIKNSYMTKEREVKIDLVDEVRSCMLAYHYPLKLDDLYVALSHIPAHKVKQVLNQNREFIYNATDEYAHVDMVDLSDDELLSISEIITRVVAEKEFIAGNELVEAIRQKHPETYERINAFSMVGIRDAIGYKLRNRFEFRGNIICEVGRNLSMAEVFGNYCKNRELITLDELNVLKNELNTDRKSVV